MKDQQIQSRDDDGRVIADMNVEGTPWHDRAASFIDRQASEAARKQTVQAYSDRMTSSEARRYTFYALLAGLALVAVMASVWIVLILFMTQIWFR